MRRGWGDWGELGKEVKTAASVTYFPCELPDQFPMGRQSITFEGNYVDCSLEFRKANKANLDNEAKKPRGI